MQEKGTKCPRCTQAAPPERKEKIDRDVVPTVPMQAPDLKRRTQSRQNAISIHPSVEKDQHHLHVLRAMHFLNLPSTYLSSHPDNSRSSPPDSRPRASRLRNSPRPPPSPASPPPASSPHPNNLCHRPPSPSRPNTASGRSPGSAPRK